MAWRFRKSARLPLGFRLNASKSDQEFSLNMACLRNRRRTVVLLIAAALLAGCHRDTENLFQAAAAGHLARVKALLVKGVDVNAPEPKCNPDNHWPTNEECTGRTALTAASWTGHLDVVQTLLAAGANVNARNDKGRTALALASEQGHLQVVQALIAAKADLNTTVPGETAGTYYTLLLAAAWKGHTETARALVDAGAKKPSRDELHQALRAAVGGEAYPPDTVQALLIAGGGTDPDINKKDSIPSWPSECKGQYCTSFSPSHAYLWGCTMLHFAAKGGNAGAVKALIEARADVNSTCYYGQTALELASVGGKLEVVKTLIAAGASVNHRDSDGNEDTALDVATRGGYLETVQALLAAKADVRTCANRPTPLMEAATLRNLELVRALLSAGADVNSTCAGTPLSMAAGKGNLEMVRFLLSQGAKVNTVSASAYSGGETALASAAFEGHLDILQALLAAKADVNAAHGAALYHAVELRHDDVARALLDAGANPSLRYPDGGPFPTPLSVSQNKEIAELLRQHGARE